MFCTVTLKLKVVSEEPSCWAYSADRALLPSSAAVTSRVSVSVDVPPLPEARRTTSYVPSAASSGMESS